jgi:RNA polymerase sigma-70 factor (ECF subfamily)
MLLTYIRATIRDPGTVDDIFQETMIVAWRRFDDDNQSRSLAAWLRGIARKLILAHYSSRGKGPAYCDEAVLEALDERLAHIDNQKGDTWKDKIAALETCMEHLPESLRRCIELFYRNDCKTEEIARQMDTTREAVKKRLQRARRLLADCLRRKGLFPLVQQETSR